MKHSILPPSGEQRRTTDQQSDFHGDFQALFREARELHSLAHPLADGEIAAMGWDDLRSWFQQSIADEVFRKKLFGQGILGSIWYVADLLVAFARCQTPSIGIADHVSGYASSGQPAAVLHAADSAFLMFVFWPEMRLHRSVRYRQMALAYGPGLYATYSAITKRPVGYQMAEAFEPLGGIARHQLMRS